jgi:hypothetical protein
MSKKFLVSLCGLLLVLGIVAVSEVSAGNITIFDNYVSGTNDGSNPYNRGNKPGEVGEVEPNCVANFSWDLQAFNLTGNTLSMTGGFNFNLGNEGVKSGDIFVATNGVPLFGSAEPAPTGFNIYGYNYAVRMDFGNNTWQAYAIDQNTAIQSAAFSQNDPSNPVRALGNLGNAAFSGALQFGGDDTNGFNVNLLNLPTTLVGKDYYHFTYDCGNDAMMGHNVPIPPSVLLLGSGLLGLAGLRKWSKRS